MYELVQASNGLQVDLISQQLPNLLERFAKYIRLKNVKDVTAGSYGVCLRCFFEWLGNNAIRNPSEDDIASFVRWLASPHKRRSRSDRAPAETDSIITYSAGTQARYLRAVKMFFKWTAYEGIYPNIAEHVKGAKVRADNSKRDAFLKDDALLLLNSIDRSTLYGKRDYAMILLSITAGLRIIEMQRANIGDIEIVAGERVLFIQGKGHAEKDAYKKLTPEVYLAISEYLTERNVSSHAAPLFASIGNRSKEMPLTEPSISRIIKDRMKQAGYDTHRLSAHSLRHTSVTMLLESGATLQEAQIHARHAAPGTTEIYAHNIDQRKTHNEQRIYDYIHGVQKDTISEVVDCIHKMNALQQARALELLKAIAG